MVKQWTSLWLGFGGRRWAEPFLWSPAQPDIEEYPSSQKPPNAYYPACHSHFWGTFPGSPLGESSGTHALGGCSRPGSNAVSLQQLWSMLVIDLSIDLFVLGVLRVTDAFSFPPSLSSQSVLMIFPSITHGLSATSVSTCFCFFFLIMNSCTHSKYTCSLFTTSRKVLSSAGSSLTFL